LFYHYAAQCTLIALRGMNTVGKLVLTLYMVTYIGLADLGIYGLLVGASIAVPAIFGFGLTDWTARQVVRLRSAEAMPLVTTRLLFTLLVHLVGQPLAWAANALLGYPIPASLVIPIALILLLEHLGTDAHAPLVARDRVMFAHVLYYFRAGLWPLVAVLLGLLYPAAPHTRVHSLQLARRTHDDVASDRGLPNARPPLAPDWSAVELAANRTA
jgi:hypothetical protein